jgi:hypothetical protein
MEISLLVSELNSLNSDRTRLKAQQREFASRNKVQNLLESRLNRPIRSLRLKSSQPQSECPVKSLSPER